MGILVEASLATNASAIANAENSTQFLNGNLNMSNESLPEANRTGRTFRLIARLLGIGRGNVF